LYGTGQTGFGVRCSGVRHGPEAPIGKSVLLKLQRANGIDGVDSAVWKSLRAQGF
jgi:hypothetical protein